MPHPFDRKVVEVARSPGQDAGVLFAADGVPEDRARRRNVPSLVATHAAAVAQRGGTLPPRVQERSWPADEVSMDGIAGVEARIAAIQARFAPAPTVSTAVSSGGGSEFSALLNEIQGSSATTATTAPAGAPTGNREQWAHDFLTRLGMPVTNENVRLMVAWQQAEGTRARFNPLATTQGMPGATSFNSVGVKNYLSYDDGITANIKAITNGRYENVLASLRRGDSAEATAQAIAASPWGTGGLVLRILQGG
jgi:hypothetical protein